MAKTTVITIASGNYLAYVRTLMGSLRDSNPAVERVLILADEGVTLSSEDRALFRTIEARELGIANFRDMTLRYDVMEFNTAIKPFAIEHIFDTTDSDNVIYLDPDICVYEPMTALFDALDGGASAVVTPHITRPVEDGLKPNDHHMLQAGVFNLGFIAVRRCDEARAFVQWWGRRMELQAHSDVQRNLFTDQRWVDLAPCFLPHLHILFDTSYNVAYWNLMQRAVTRNGDRIDVDGRPLTFFHFSGLSQSEPQRVSKHQDRLEWSDIEPLQPLFADYRARLASNGWGAKDAPAYHYDRLGPLRLNPVLRILYQRLFPDRPADREIGADELVTLANRETKLGKDTEYPITALMALVHELRPDVQAVFPLTSPDGVRGFARWFHDQGRRDYQLDDALIVLPNAPGDAKPAPVDPTLLAEVQDPSLFQRGEPNAHRGPLFRHWRKLRRAVLNAAGRP